jgi:peptidoglycan/xylan/chitin deacetylase (PgdA/CDA1 family)
MNYLAENGFSTSLASADLTGGCTASAKGVCLTFDDAYECVFANAFPILHDHGFCASVFVIAGYVGRHNSWDVQLSRPVRHMNWQQLRTLAAAGWEIGSHSLSHRDLSSLPTKALLAEVVDSKACLEDHLGCPVRAFSYPFGVFSERVVEAVRNAGYLVAYGMHVPEKLKGLEFHPFNRARRPVYLFDCRRSFARKLSDNATCCQALFERVVNFSSRGTILVKGSKIA